MERGSTVFLRLVIAGMGLLVAVFCVIVLPVMHREWALEFPELAYLKYPVLLGISLTTVPFYMALYQAVKLLGYVDKNTAFSLASVQALKRIKYYALTIGGIYVVGMPLIYYIAEIDDAPGLIIFGMMFTVAPIAIATFAAVLQKLLQNAIEFKQENDLTV